ncbi:DUF421 domain-containing protein [Adhaeribacter sp. BT258]|uniref:DUF421 domain-containing protein n=1 Tax=Adhaeribacter terrigena TaxID=2793070 RepID=A0ABS1C588_9BACT|nr:YetF domain-containing protein [Adhaeribacter terrigena]MBK0404347.1 DUF421 domain-containing protein [Adhaeribacter terrigena]
MLDFLNTLIGPDSKDILWWQMGVRGILVFLLTLFMVRYGDRRIFSKSTALDLVLAIILGSILSRAITGNSPFFATLFTALLLVGFHWLLAMTSFHIKGFGKYVKGRETQLIKDGNLLWNKMEQEKISLNDLYEACRKSKMQDLTNVKDAFFERSGDISLIPFGKDEKPAPKT